MSGGWCGRPRDNGGFPTVNIASEPEPTDSTKDIPEWVPRRDQSDAAAAAGSVGLADATARPSNSAVPRAPAPAPAAAPPEPATFTGIDGADVDPDVLAELPADVRAEVHRQMKLWRATRRGAGRRP